MKEKLTSSFAALFLEVEALATAGWGVCLLTEDDISDFFSFSFSSLLKLAFCSILQIRYNILVEDKYFLAD